MVGLSGLKSRALNPVRQSECHTAQLPLCFMGPVCLLPSAIAQLSYKANEHHCRFLWERVDGLRHTAAVAIAERDAIPEGAHVPKRCTCLRFNNLSR